MTRAISCFRPSSRDSNAATSASDEGGATRLVVTRGSRGHGVHDNVHAEFGVVLGQEALVAEVVVPFAPIVLVAVEQRDAPVDRERLQIIMYEVVPPAV